jgi:glycosyltransferase involved in cell wall biosynthesis
MCRRTANSMETVAHTLREHSRVRSDVRILCDAGAVEPLADDLITVPAGLSKRRRADAVAQVLRSLKPDYVEYHQQLESSASLARRLPGMIHVLYRHTRIKPPGNPIGRMRYEARLRAFDHLVFVSEAASAEFLRDYPSFAGPKYAGRISAICNPIDSPTWHGDPNRCEKLILFSGRAMKEKGLEPFCAALATVLDQSPDWRGALMLGDWDRHKVWAEPVIRTLDRFGDRVEIHKSAPLSDVVAMTRRAAIAVAPSFVAEALGLTALEAHAAGAALISSGRGGLREASGPFAVYVDPPEAEGLTLAMAGLVADDERRTTMARQGQARVAQVHSAPTRSGQLDDLREKLMSEAAART